jgi:branched-chain amino acid aminotransferase
MASVPFDQLDGEIWYNGEFVPWKDAKVHVLSHGLHYASAVFEGERAYGGEIFKLTEHTERLHKSGEILGFKIPYSVAEIDQATVELLGRQGLRGCLCASHRLARFGDDGRFGPEANRINLAIAIWQWPSYFDPEAADEGHPARHGRVQASRSDEPRPRAPRPPDST